MIRFSDIITVHTPLTEETRDIINAEHFEGMKDGVIMVNCARGGIINEAAMLDALNSGKCVGAAFDVWSEEPPKSEILRQLIAHPNMLVTPHLGANTREARRMWLSMSAMKLSIMLMVDRWRTRLISQGLIPT